MKIRSSIIFFIAIGFALSIPILIAVGKLARGIEGEFAYGVVMQTSSFCNTYHRLPNSYDELHDWTGTSYKHADHIIVFNWGVPIENITDSTRIVIVKSPFIKSIEPELNQTLRQDIEHLQPQKGRTRTVSGVSL